MDEPNASMRCITRFEEFKCWRVFLPQGVGGGQVYFNDSDYGGSEQALREARYFRDDRFNEIGIPIMARTNITSSRKDRGEVLAIYERKDQRGADVILGTWMETVDGKPRQRKVQRSCRTYGVDEARRLVESHVRQAVEREAARLATAEAHGTLRAGDGFVGSRRNRKSV